MNMAVNIMGKGLSFHQKAVEEKLSQIGAKIAKATEYSEKAANLCVDSQSILMLAQDELSELYMSLEDGQKPHSPTEKK